MKGFYEMVNLSTTETFEAEVPTFKFAAPFALN